MVNETGLKGAYVVEPQRFEDARGFLARSWSLKELPGWEGVAVVESNVSFNLRRGTLRGMHYQAAPHGQAKIVRCTRGSIYDVVIDLRPDSPTFRRWVGVELTARNRLTLCVPAEFAHGFQTLEDETEVFYLVSNYYAPDAARGVRWNDPAFRIEWPEAPAEGRVMADRDRDYADFRP
jgi:dTDP-4-dehydrorhamnose 3,5-epimerase